MIPLSNYCASYRKTVIYEKNTKDLLPHIMYLKDLSKTYNKYITSAVSHMSFADILGYLNNMYLINIEDHPFEPTQDDELGGKLNSFQNGMLSMVSGGIDSPVSTEIMYRYCQSRGSSIKLLHFSSNVDKVGTVKNIRDKIDCMLELYIVDFSKLQDAITTVCPEKYRTILYKVFMVRIANRIACIEKLRCIIMGNSWGQVASQTCENLYVTDKFSDLPIYNPLLGLSKTQIISQARAIDTYNESILTGTNDCCVMYLPKHPVLKADPRIIDEYLTKFNNFMDMVTIVKV